MRQLELESQRETQALSSSPGMYPPSTSANQNPFHVSKYVTLIPTFRESEVDCYFSTFERIASALHWPQEAWPLLVQFKIHGKAQEAIAALPLEESLKYDSVKAAILFAYIPEAYRQKFRNRKNLLSQTFSEFARDKGILFDKWIVSSEVNDFESLRELILLEEFKNCIPDRIVVHLNEQRSNLLAAAAVLADEYVLTHKTAFPMEKPCSSSVNTGSMSKPQGLNKEKRKCFVTKLDMLSLTASP